MGSLKEKKKTINSMWLVDWKDWDTIVNTHQEEKIVFS